MTARHPRDGYAVALFLGTNETAPEGTRSLLIEIAEHYNAAGDPRSLFHHYDGWYLDSRKLFCVLTVGGIRFDPTSREPPDFVARHNPGYTWRRLR